MSLRIEGLFGAASLEGFRIEGRRSQGVPPGGAFDQRSYRLANALVGNTGPEACLELGLGTGTFEALDALLLAAAGCDAVVRGTKIEGGRSFVVGPGDVLKLLPPVGARSYLAVTGGWRSLEGRSALLGGRSGTAGKKILVPTAYDRWRPLRFIPAEGEHGALDDVRAVVSPILDRAGIRLICNVAHPPRVRSEPVTLGAIQALPGGGLVIIGPDGPTIGGYARLGAVCRVDWDRLGQLRPGDEVAFEEIDVEAARRLWDDYEYETRGYVDGITHDF